MNRLSLKERAQILRCLVEGNSIRSTARITDHSRNTITSLLVDVGRACQKYQDETLVNLSCTQIQCDEIWTFCHSKQRNVSPEKQGILGYGDVWTWTAICAHTKLVPTWAVGDREAETAQFFISDLASRLKNRIQLTTDGHKAYLTAVEEIFGANVDYAMLVKLYGGRREDTQPKTQKRYSPRICTGTSSKTITGTPNLEYVSTSYAERQNLNMRMSMRRFTRLTNAFSKKLDNLIHAIALYFMHYNFGRIHQALRVTPAMEAGVTSHVWELEEIAALAN